MVTEKALVKSDPFALMDYLDDIQIVQEIKGAVLKEWVYVFPMGEKVVEGLSKAGVDACAAELARKRGEVLREIDFSLIQNPDNVIATIKAGRFAVSADGHEVMLETVFGVKCQARKELIYDRDADGKRKYDQDGHAISHLEDDPFVVEKAMMKAARNAKKRLIPMDLQQAVLAQARIESGRVKTVEGDGKPSDAPICPEHKKAMTQGKYGWYCKTRVGEGYCKYKPPVTQKASPPSQKPEEPATEDDIWGPDTPPSGAETPPVKIPPGEQGPRLSGKGPLMAISQWREALRLGMEHKWTETELEKALCQHYGVKSHTELTVAQANDILVSLKATGKPWPE